MSRIYLALLSLISMVVLSGCCAFKNCNNCGQSGPGCCLFRGFQNQTIAPPPTYGVNIPSQNYYNTAQNPNYLVNPSATAPTPAGNTPSLAPQNGWQEADGNNGSQSSLNSTAPVSVLAGNQNPPDRLASLATNSGFNTAQPNQNSVNYQSTSVDERRDESRIPVTDATGVRAPANLYNPYPGVDRAAQARYGSSLPVNQNPPIRGNVPVLTVPGQMIVNGQVVNPPNYYAQPVNYQGNYNGNVVTYPGQVVQGSVLARATAEYDPRNNPNYDSGWRDRELTTDNTPNR